MKKILLCLIIVILLTGCGESKEEKEKYYDELTNKFKDLAIDYYNNMEKENFENYTYIISLYDMEYIENIDFDINEFKRYNSEELCDKYLSKVIITNQFDDEKYPDKKEAITVQLICEEKDIYFN